MFSHRLQVGFVASICSKLSDTVSSEVGKAYGRTTYLATTFERVPRGTEGAVSLVTGRQGPRPCWRMCLAVGDCDERSLAPQAGQPGGDDGGRGGSRGVFLPSPRPGAGARASLDCAPQITCAVPLCQPYLSTYLLYRCSVCVSHPSPDGVLACVRQVGSTSGALIVASAAVAANTFESVLGASVQGRVGWLTNDVVNVIQITLAAALAVLSGAMLGAP